MQASVLFSLFASLLTIALEPLIGRRNKVFFKQVEKLYSQP